MNAPPFAARCQWSTEETLWAKALRDRRASGLPVFDLTASNPTRCGFRYEPDILLAPLADRRALDYDPDPRGPLAARRAVAEYYRDLGAGDLAPERIFLTTGTSEAYSFLFRLLCDAGDEVLIAAPSYPLFDFLAEIDDVRLRHYPLFYDHGWRLDGVSLRRSLTPRTRAIAVVHPNNPTGHFIAAEEREELASICCEFGLALLVDEVFFDYPLDPMLPRHSFVGGDFPALTFVLSGVSKICGLPQMKASWIACAGPESLVSSAAEKLEVIADTFLSMNAAVACALPVWLRERESIQLQILSRVRGNLNAVDEILTAGCPVTRLAVEGGWYAVLRVPALEPDEELAVRLLRDAGVAVHPGSFFGFRASGYLVVSLLPPHDEFARGIELCVAAASAAIPATGGSLAAGTG
jgi:alanine-synthesizing transaminase